MKNFGMLLLLLVFTACQSEANQDMSRTSMATEEAEADYYGGEAQKLSDGSDQLPLETERKLIKTAEIRFQVKDLRQSTQKMEALTQEFSGFLSGMNQVNSHYSVNNTLTVRIPAAELDRFLEAVETESIYTDYKRIHAADVTEEFVDISARLETKKAVRDRYLNILRERAQNVEDILNAEEKIRVIQEEIESIEGRLKYINNRTSLSTVTLELYQKIDYVAPPDHQSSFFSQLKKGFLGGWELILDLAIGLVSIWPILVIVALLFVFRKRFRFFRS